MLNVRKLLVALAAVIVLIGAGAPLYANESADQEDRRAERAADAYEEGTDAIDEDDWEEAIRHFTKVVELKGSKSDGALYWTAYALQKLGRRGEAQKTIEALMKNYPQSRWLNDAKAMEIDLKQARGERVSPESISDEELKVIAINSLMHTDPEKAFPLLEKIVKGPSSKKIKEKALFILSQSSSPRAHALMASMARGQANPDLQKDAVRYLGINGTERNRQTLSEVYASASTREVKEEVLQAFMVAGDRARVLAAAKGEQDVKLRTHAIHLLGVMGARADLHAMYASETSRDAKEEILQALFVAGDVDRMSDLARNEKDMSLRVEAIRRLGMMSRRSGETLVALYNEGNAEVKDAVLDGLFVQGNAKALIDLAKKEKNAELKREILQKLSVMGNDDAIAYMLQILEQ